MRRLLALGTVLVFAVGCSDAPPTQPATASASELASSDTETSSVVTSQQRTTLPFFIPVVEACNGEAISGEVTLHTVTSSTTTPNGRVNSKLHANWKGQGEGMETGAKYQFQFVSNITNSFDADDAPQIITASQTIRLVGQGKVPDRRVTFVGHFTLNANGEVVRNEVTVNDNTCS